MPEENPMLYGYYPHLNPRRASGVQSRDPETDAAAIAEFGLSFAPGSGEAMSARDAWDASGRAGNALLQGNYGEAAGQYANMATGVLGALPGVGVIARGTKRGARWMNENLPGGVNKMLDAITPSDPQNTTFIFAGPTAKTADHAALSKAEEMASSGASRDDIWNQTGWFQGADGKWRFEIDDSGARFNASPEIGGHRVVASELGQALDHQPLSDAYPYMSGITLGRDAPPGSGYFQEAWAGAPARISIGQKNARTDRANALHEVQHAIQVDEGFGRGGSRSSFTSDDLANERQRVMSAPASDDALRRDLYRRLAGEVEARNVEMRMGMTPSERRSIPPWKTQDTSDDMQIVRNVVPGVAESHPIATPWVGSRHVDRFADDLESPRAPVSPFWNEMMGANEAARADPAAIAEETARRQMERNARQRYLDMFDPNVMQRTSYGWKRFEDQE